MCVWKFVKSAAEFFFCSAVFSSRLVEDFIPNTGLRMSTKVARRSCYFGGHLDEALPLVNAMTSSRAWKWPFLVVFITAVRTG